MDVAKFGSRTSAPAFFDMAARFRPHNAHWYGNGFRIGDRAAAYVFLKCWRRDNPGRRLVVVEDNWIEGTEYSRWLPAKWLFAGIADEVWSVSKAGERVVRPAGEPLYTKTLWAFWHSFMRSARAFEPDIRPDEVSLKRAGALLQEFKVPDDFVTIQPLFDAHYDVHRNQKAGWWQRVIEHSCGSMPVVVLGVFPNSHRMKLPHNCYPIIARGVDPMVSLALISKAALHMGGATGTTLWAPILRVPTLAVYAHWGPTGDTDVRPISFGRPVIYSPLRDDAQATAARLLSAYQQHGKEAACAAR